ncbi:hypothetical protein ONZ45_g15785 [Pleurotus djamor]|nr:hypothetical protein ONZ45_g15785 [Pleurotus djamor]
MWVHLGSERPEHIGRIERAIWDAVYAVACAPSGLNLALSALRTELKELGNASVSHADHAFFHQLQPIILDSSSHASLPTVDLRPPSLTPHPTVATSLPLPQSPLPLPPAGSTTIVPQSNETAPASHSSSPYPKSSLLQPPDASTATVPRPTDTDAPSTSTSPIASRAPSPSAPHPGASTMTVPPPTDTNAPSTPTSPVPSRAPSPPTPHPTATVPPPNAADPPSTPTSPTPTAPSSDAPRRIATLPPHKPRRITIVGPNASLAQKRKRSSHPTNSEGEGGRDDSHRSPRAGQKRKRGTSPHSTSSEGEADANDSEYTPDATAAFTQTTRPGIERPKRKTNPINPMWFKVPKSTKKRRLSDYKSTPAPRAATIPYLITESDKESFHCDLPVIYDLRGDPVEVRPLVSTREDSDTFQALFQSMIRSSDNLPPRYTSSAHGQGIMIQILSYANYQDLSFRGLDEHLKTGPVVVTGVPNPVDLKTFREAILSMERSLDTEALCRDLDVPLGPSATGQWSLASLKDLLCICADPDNQKRVHFPILHGPLNGYLPIVHEDTIDRICYRATWRYGDRRPSPDLSYLQWNTASTPWTFDTIHMPPGGFMTVILPAWGRTLCAVFRRKDDHYGSRPINWNTAEEVVASPEYDVDYVILEPGTAMFLPAGCPHFILNLGEPSLIHGSFHYLGGCIMQHMFSFLHALAIPHISDYSVRQTQTTLAIVSRIVVMYEKWSSDSSVYSDTVASHLPHFGATNSVQEYLIVCVVGRLLPWVYPDAEDATIASSAAAHCLATLGSRWALLDENQVEIDFYNDLYLPYLFHVCRVFVALSSVRYGTTFSEHVTRLKPSLVSTIPEAKGFDDVDGWDDITLDDKRLDLRIQTPYSFGLPHTPAPSV